MIGIGGIRTGHSGTERDGGQLRIGISAQER